jgi:small basic protein
MYIAIIGLLIGIALGTYAPFQIPIELAHYTAIGILGILDSMLGALRADLQGKYDANIFLSGLIFNMVIAVGITYLGDKLSLDLYLAAIVVFTIRIFSNLGTIRYSFIERRIGRKRVKEEIEGKAL